MQKNAKKKILPRWAHDKGRFTQSVARYDFSLFVVDEFDKGAVLCAPADDAATAVVEGGSLGVVGPSEAVDCWLWVHLFVT